MNHLNWTVLPYHAGDDDLKRGDVCPRHFIVTGVNGDCGDC